MDIRAGKSGLIEWIAGLDDATVIGKVKEVYEEYLVASGLKHEMSIPEKESVERGLKDIEEGRVHPHETARKIYEKYL